MDAFEFFVPTKIIFGSGKLAEVGNAAKSLGKRPLLLTGKSHMRSAGITDRVEKALKAAGLNPVLFEKVEPNPRVETLDEAVALGLKEKVDFVIGLGGGSVMDSAKFAGAALGAAKGTNPVVAPSVWDFTSGGPAGRQEVKNSLPTLLITSTAATGTEGNCAAVVTKWSTNEKAAMWSPGCYPTISIVDPELMLSLPLSATRDGAVDMMMHVLETYFAGHNKSGVQDAVTEGLCRGVMENLNLLEKNTQDLTARENLSWASIAALLGGGPNLGRSGGFVVHQIEHPISGYKDVSHGSGLAALWPRYMRLIAEKRADKIAQFGNVCLGVNGSGDGAAAKTLDELDSWLKKHEMWFTLKDFGVQENEIDALTDQALAISGGGREFLEGPMPINRERIKLIYQAAF